MTLRPGRHQGLLSGLARAGLVQPFCETSPVGSPVSTQLQSKSSIAYNLTDAWLRKLPKRTACQSHLARLALVEFN